MSNAEMQAIKGGDYYVYRDGLTYTYTDEGVLRSISSPD